MAKFLNLVRDGQYTSLNLIRGSDVYKCQWDNRKDKYHLFVIAPSARNMDT